MSSPWTEFSAPIITSPILSELKAAVNEHYDFETNFDHLILPLKGEELLLEELEEYILTEKGEKHLKNFINNFKYYDVHRSDEILLAMSQDTEKGLLGSETVNTSIPTKKKLS